MRYLVLLLYRLDWVLQQRQKIAKKGGGFMDTRLCIDGGIDSVDTIKYCALYFDHIKIDRPVHIITPRFHGYREGEITYN